MALERDLQTLELEKWIGAREAQVLARAEALVPGAGRDAIEPLLADASLYIGQADLQSDRVVLEGTASCQAEAGGIPSAPSTGRPLRWKAVSFSRGLSAHVRWKVRGSRTMSATISSSGLSVVIGFTIPCAALRPKPGYRPAPPTAPSPAFISQPTRLEEASSS